MTTKIKILVFFCIYATVLFRPIVSQSQVDANTLQDSETQKKLSRVKKNLTQKTKSNTKNKLKKKRPRDTGQSATIKIDGSAVYEHPNFDSAVMEYMDQEKKVQISQKIFAGIGGLGSFYKIRIRKGVYGYIADTDVVLKDGSSIGDKKNEQNSETSDPLSLQDSLMNDTPPDESSANGDSIYLNRYIGLAYYNINYSEKLRNKTEEAGTVLFGLKHSGSTGFLGGIPMDVTVLFTTTAPDFYDEIATSTSGFMLLGDGLITIPLSESKRHILYYGGGLVFRYSSWDVKLKTGIGPVDSQEVTMGVVGVLGGGFSFSPKYILRLDGKYYYEKQKYFGFGAAFQFKY